MLAFGFLLLAGAPFSSGLSNVKGIDALITTNPNTKDAVCGVDVDSQSVFGSSARTI